MSPVDRRANWRSRPHWHRRPDGAKLIDRASLAVEHAATANDPVDAEVQTVWPSTEKRCETLVDLAFVQRALTGVREDVFQANWPPDDGRSVAFLAPFPVTLLRSAPARQGPSVAPSLVIRRRHPAAHPCCLCSAASAWSLLPSVIPADWFVRRPNAVRSPSGGFNQYANGTEAGMIFPRTVLSCWSNGPTSPSSGLCSTLVTHDHSRSGISRPSELRDMKCQGCSSISPTGCSGDGPGLG